MSFLVFEGIRARSLGIFFDTQLSICTHRGILECFFYPLKASMSIAILDCVRRQHISSQFSHGPSPLNLDNFKLIILNVQVHQPG